MADRRIARLFGDARRRRLLLSFVGRQRSLKEAADLVGMPINLVLYHVRKLLAHGLLEVVREQKRAGRAIRFYQSPFERFVIPASLLDKRPTDRLVRSLEKAMENARDLAGSSVLLEVDEAGRPRMRELVGQGGAPFEIWRRLKLRREDSARLFGDLSALIHRYQSECHDKAPEWTLHLALAETS